jgi:hypothetical protein
LIRLPHAPRPKGPISSAFKLHFDDIFAKRKTGREGFYRDSRSLMPKFPMRSRV